MATDASAGAAAPPADPYAAARANLRDTVKWLAATFSALAAVVLAGSPVSGLGKLPAGTPAWWGAGAALLIAFVCICLALVITVALLRSDALHLSDLDPDSKLDPLDASDREEIAALRRTIDARAVDVLPPNYPSLAELMPAARARRQALVDASKALRAAADAAAKEEAARRITLAQERMDRFAPSLTRVLAYGVYIRFYERLRRAMPQLFGLGIAALVSLTAFGILVQAPDKAEEPKTLIFNNIPAAAPASAPVAGLPALEPVGFATGKALLTPEGLAAVDKARAALREHPQTSLLLYAHTDTVAGARVNAALARRRALAVREALVAQGGVGASRVFVSELPESALPALTAQEQANEANRAVLMKLVAMPR
ncbi:OmpA family protein [Piscinibacter sp.]|uniref:OmpA family protein n=1 Tax=Piscinibacter sp. TaxID=1903157 RepID=UPI002B64A84B|nr:OmpA family protein [Albitalea sp.]HUG22228.1 OmpA family protein [Albitalea sp.]